MKKLNDDMIKEVVFKKKLRMIVRVLEYYGICLSLGMVAGFLANIEIGLCNIDNRLVRSIIFGANIGIAYKMVQDIMPSDKFAMWLYSEAEETRNFKELLKIKQEIMKMKEEDFVESITTIGEGLS